MKIPNALSLTASIMTLFSGTTLVRADWHIVANRIVSGPGFCSTNRYIQRVGTNAVSEDLSPTQTRMFWLATENQVLLDHANKTYSRQLTAHAEQGEPPSRFCAHELNTLAGRPAETYRWTNGPTSG